MEQVANHHHNPRSAWKPRCNMSQASNDQPMTPSNASSTSIEDDNIASSWSRSGDRGGGSCGSSSNSSRSNSSAGTETSRSAADTDRRRHTSAATLPPTTTATATATGTGTIEADSDRSNAKPDDLQQPASPPQTATAAAREWKLNILASCRERLLAQERARLTKGRIGTRAWVTFWKDVYEPRLYRALGGRVSEAATDVDRAFRGATGRLCGIIARTAEGVVAAESQAQMEACWRAFERRVRHVTAGRARAVNGRLQALRESIEGVPISVSDGLWDGLKRNIFAVDITADYGSEDSGLGSLRRAGRGGSGCGGGRPGRRHLPRPADFARDDPSLMARAGFSQDFQGAMERGLREDMARALRDQLIPLAMRQRQFVI